jgi:predicted dehydrogenase
MNMNSTKKMNRRQMLAASSAVVGATRITGAFAAGDETIKVALVGCGSRGTGAITQCLSTKGPVKLWAMADLFEDRLESSLATLVKGEKRGYDREAHEGFGSRIDVPPERRFLGFDAYQKAIDSGVDMVILTTPPHFRPACYEYAVKQGKHVFMEKPLAVDSPGIRQILSANEEACKKNLKVSVGLHMRHNQCMQETVRRIKDGSIGPVQFMRAYWNTGFARDTPARSPDVSEMRYQLRNPYHFVWLSGDYFVDALMHYIDACLWVKGEHPVMAQGQGGRQVQTPLQNGDIYDHINVEFAFADETRLFASNRQISGCWNSASGHAHGTTGRADIGRGRIEGVSAWQFRGKIANPYQVEHDVLMEAIRQNRAHNEVEYAAQSTMTAIMGRMASYSGQMVTWEQAINANVRLAPERYAFDAQPPAMAGADGIYPVALPGMTKVL